MCEKMLDELWTVAVELRKKGATVGVDDLADQGGPHLSVRHAGGRWGVRIDEGQFRIHLEPVVLYSGVAQAGGLAERLGELFGKLKRCQNEMDDIPDWVANIRDLVREVFPDRVCLVDTDEPSGCPEVTVNVSPDEILHVVLMEDGLQVLAYDGGDTPEVISTVADPDELVEVLSRFRPED